MFSFQNNLSTFPITEDLNLQIATNTDTPTHIIIAKHITAFWFVRKKDFVATIAAKIFEKSIRSLVVCL